MRSYSYTTVVVEPDGTARTSVNVYPDESLRVLCTTGGPRAQISLDHAGASVLIVPTNAEAPTAEDVRAARRLAESFAVYAAEVERLHATSVDGASGKGEGRAP